MKTKDIILGGAVIGLAVLLYFKFGRKKAEEKTGSSNGGGIGTSTGVLIDTTNEPTKTVVPNGTNKGCGDFTLYFGDKVNEFKWNNGKPSVVKSRLLAYPSAPPQTTYVKASGSVGYVDREFFYITIDQYNKACADKASGLYNNPTVSGGVKPVDTPIIEGTGGIKPLPVKTASVTHVLVSDIKVR